MFLFIFRFYISSAHCKEGFRVYFALGFPCVNGSQISSEIKINYVIKNNSEKQTAAVVPHKTR